MSLDEQIHHYGTALDDLVRQIDSDAAYRKSSGLAHGTNGFGSGPSGIAVPAGNIQKVTGIAEY